MGYQVKDNREFSWPVTVHVPNADGGSDSFTFTAKFVVLDPDARRDLSLERDALLGAILHGWDGLEDEDGNPLAFDEGGIAAVARDPFLSAAIVMAYGTALSPEAQRKN